MCFTAVDQKILSLSEFPKTLTVTDIYRRGEVGGGGLGEGGSYTHKLTVILMCGFTQSVTDIISKNIDDIKTNYLCNKQLFLGHA